jgi:hypothetical protein
MVSAYQHTCDMMPKSQMFGVKEGLQRHPLLHSSLLKYVSMAKKKKNTYTTIEELWSSTEPARYEVEPLSMETLGRTPQSVQFLCSATASNWQWNKVQDITTWTHWTLVALSYPLWLVCSHDLHTLLRLQLFTYPLLEAITKQWVCEDIADCKDLKCAVVICRLWKVAEVL